MDGDWPERNIGTMSPRDLPSPVGLKEEIADLFARESAGMLRYACPLAGDPDMARDAVQEAFFRFFIVRSSGQSIVSPKAWLFRVVRNYLFDYRRAASRIAAGMESLRDVPDPSPSPGGEDIVDLVQGLPQIGLSPREVECVRLRMEDLRYDEIAGVLGLQPGTVGALLNRAHDKIRKAVAARMQQEHRATRALTEEKRYAS